MAAKMFILVVAGHWSPVSAQWFCCASKEIGLKPDDALTFGKAARNNYGDLHKATGWHCGAGLKLELSIGKSGLFSQVCNLDEWITKAETAPSIFEDLAGNIEKGSIYLATFMANNSIPNEADVKDSIHYYFKKLLTQISLFAANHRDLKLKQSSTQTSYLYAMARITAERRTNCESANLFLKVAKKVIGCKKKGEQSPTHVCEQLRHDKGVMKERYCEEWNGVKQKDCETALSRHTWFGQKIVYYLSESSSVSWGD